MNKKYYLFAGALLSLLLVSGVLWKLQSARTIAASTMSVSEQNRLEETLAITDDLQFQLFFNQQTVPYDLRTDTYYLPQRTDGRWMKEASFTLADDRMRLYWYEDAYWEDLETAIEEGHAFAFLVTDGETAKRGKIVFTGLPMMKIDRIETLEDESFYCKVTVYDPFHNDQGLYETFCCDGILGIRGKTSQQFPKKGWNLDLIKESGKPYKTSLFGLRTDDEWKLNALYPDGTKVRERLAMDLWNQMAEQTDSPHDSGTRMEYFELMLESDYHGIYGAMEPLDYKQLSLDRAEDVLYKGYAWPREGNTDEHALNGASDYCGHLIRVGERKITEELWQPLVEYVAAANFADKEESFDPEALYEYIQEHMDMDNLLNSELFVQMLYAFDNKYKNFYVSADLQDDGSYKLWKSPWDLNYSFGDRYSIEGNALTLYNLEWSEEIMPEFMMTEILLEAGNEEFAGILNEKWEVLKEDIFSMENVQQIADYAMEQLNESGAFARDEERWPDGPHENSTEAILEFHSCRLNFLDEHYTSFLYEN